MKRTIYLLPILLLLSSCSLFQKKTDDTNKKTLSEELIIGKWTVTSIKLGDRTIGQDVFGKNATMIFAENGDVVVDLPQQPVERSYYKIENNKIVDPNNPNEFMEILSITDSKLHIKLISEGQDPVEMRLKK